MIDSITCHFLRRGGLKMSSKTAFLARLRALSGPAITTEALFSLLAI